MGFTAFQKPVTCIQSLELIDLEKDIIKELETTLDMKAFLVASSHSMFSKYFPSLKQHYDYSRQGMIFIINGILREYPCLSTSGKVSVELTRDLGYILKIILDISEKNKLLERQEVSDDSVVIDLLTRQWKGKTSNGLGAIINAVEWFEGTYPDYQRVFRPRAFLPHVFSGYSGDRRDFINKWYCENFKEGKGCDSLSLVKKYHSQMPAVTYDTREKVLSSATKRQSQKFWDILKREECSQDFWDISVIVDKDHGEY